jgi:hypothetical protein
MRKTHEKGSDQGEKIKINEVVNEEGEKLSEKELLLIVW